MLLLGYRIAEEQSSNILIRQNTTMIRRKKVYLKHYEFQLGRYFKKCGKHWIKIFFIDWVDATRPCQQFFSHDEEFLD